MKVRGDYTCPLELTHDITKGKWKPIILWQLRLGNTSLASLEKNIQGINQKMLIEHIKELLDCGMVNKNVFEGYPLKVEFSLMTSGLFLVIYGMTLNPLRLFPFLADKTAFYFIFNVFSRSLSN